MPSSNLTAAATSSTLNRMKAPPFTAANAAEMGRRGGLKSAQARADRLAKAQADAEELRLAIAKQAAFEALTPDDDQRRLNRVKKQADLIADRIDSCLADDDDDRLTVLTQALARLWPLVTPTAGTLKPKSGSSKREMPRPV